MAIHEPRYRKGDKIGRRYLVHKALAGGMGEVYLCLDLQEMVPRALKTFHARFLTSPKARVYFEREAATWVALEKHPNIVRCFYMNDVDHIPFLFLEWVAGTEAVGTDLREWLVRRGPLEPRRALEFILDVCRALEHAQKKVPGFVHCDIKPENVLVAQGQLAKLTDFGLARLVRDAGLVPDERGARALGVRLSVSSAGGTPPYMAPEQWRGEPVDGRTDVYSVGCLLYELVSGQWPFRAMNPEDMMQRHLKTVPLPLDGVVRGLPGKGLDAVLARCLAKEPVKRYSSASALMAAIAGLYESWHRTPPRAVPEAGGFAAADYCSRGVTYYNLGLHAEALADYDAAIRIDPNNAIFYSNRGNANDALGRHEEARANYDAAIRIDPDYFQAYSNRGNMYTGLGRYAEALADHDTAIGIEPGSAQAYLNRGSTYLKQDRHTEALADFDTAIRIDANQAVAYTNRGSTYASLGRLVEALTDYDAAVQLDTNQRAAYYNRGLMYAKLGHHAEALADFDAAIRIDPNDAASYTNRGITYASLGRCSEALSDYETAIRIDPNDAVAYYNRGNEHDALGRRTEALADYDAAIRIDPSYLAAYSNRGKTYAELGRYDESLADFDAAIRIDPNDAKAYFNRATTYRVLGGLAEALADYDSAIRIDPKFAQSHLNKGVVLIQRGEWDDALHAFETAARLGEPMGVQNAARLRQARGLPPGPAFANPAQQALEALLEADEPRALRRALDRHPILTRPDFLAAIEQVVAQQVPPAERLALRQRLDWLRQLIAPQADL